MGGGVGWVLLLFFLKSYVYLFVNILFILSVPFILGSLCPGDFLGLVVDSHLGDSRQ